MIKITRIFAILMTVTFIMSAAMFAEEVEVLTNATCSACKTKNENGLKTKAGIQKTTLNLDNKVCTIKYDAKKTNPEAVVKTISDLGYTASIVTDDSQLKTSAMSGKDCKMDSKACKVGSKECKVGSKDCKMDGKGCCKGMTKDANKSTKDQPSVK